MSREHKDRTEEERKAAAQIAHAENRLRKLDTIITAEEAHLKRHRAERKRLQKVLT